MDIKEAILSRHSVRGYLDQPVSRKLLEDVINLGCRAVSSVNSQPWKFAVLGGNVIREVAYENGMAFLQNLPVDYEERPLNGVYRERSREIGKMLFQAADIQREDKARRLWWAARGFRFFDAPAAILIFMDESLDERYYRLDCGAVIQNICLAAEVYGLSTCVEDQAISYQSALKKRGLIPAGTRPVTGIAIGYADPSFAANNVVTPRVPASENTAWYGF